MTGWRPDWVVAPGDLLAEQLAERNMSERLGAKALGMTPSDLAALVTGDLALTEEMARRLASLFGMSAMFWLNLERNYRDGLARGLERLDIVAVFTGPAYSGKAS